MKNKKLYFISGLPRSGSTLLANILAQNPQIHSTPTSACHDAMIMIRNNWNVWIEHKASKELSNEESLKNILNSILYNYHNTDRPIIIDKGRGWISVIEMLTFAMGERPKILVPVRNMAQIVSSFEKLHRKNMHKRAESGDFFQSQTIRGRADDLLSAKGVIGISYNRLQDVMQRGWNDCLHFVEFDDLTANPKKVMSDIYTFLEEPPFDHDFNNVQQYTHEDDSVHGFDGLHTIRPKVLPVTDDSADILGMEFAMEFNNTEFWRN